MIEGGFYQVLAPAQGPLSRDPAVTGNEDFINVFAAVSRRGPCAGWK